MKKAVGFDQKILIHQLDFMAKEIPRTDKRDDLYEKMDDFLTADIRGNKSRLNARTMIFKIWYLVDEDHKDLQKRALILFRQVSNEERIALHWGLTLLAYPFFRDLVNELGLLYRLQDEVTSYQINKKIKALYGDRRRVEVATSAVLTSLRSWGVIYSEKRNVQIMSEKVDIQSPELKSWLAEVLIRALGVEALPIERFSEYPMLFPFSLNVQLEDLSSDHFSKIRQGVDKVVIGLK